MDSSTTTIFLFEGTVKKLKYQIERFCDFVVVVVVLVVVVAVVVGGREGQRGWGWGGGLTNEKPGN